MYRTRTYTFSLNPIRTQTWHFQRFRCADKLHPALCVLMWPFEGDAETYRNLSPFLKTSKFDRVRYEIDQYLQYPGWIKRHSLNTECSAGIFEANFQLNTS